jgi:hypothetical protein
MEYCSSGVPSGAFVLMPRHQRRGAAAMNGMDLALALRRGRLVQIPSLAIFLF